jgi:hypothetical protein
MSPVRDCDNTVRGRLAPDRGTRPFCVVPYYKVRIVLAVFFAAPFPGKRVGSDHRPASDQMQLP